MDEFFIFVMEVILILYHDNLIILIYLLGCNVIRMFSYVGDIGFIMLEMENMNEFLWDEIDVIMRMKNLIIFSYGVGMFYDRLRIFVESCLSIKVLSSIYQCYYRFIFNKINTILWNA
jgi:hypothetical protein